MIKNFFTNKTAKKKHELEPLEIDDAEEDQYIDFWASIKNPDLLTVIRALQKDDNVENRTLFLDLFKEATLIIAKNQQDEQITNSETGEQETITSLELALLQKNEKIYYTVFTDIEIFDEWQSRLNPADVHWKPGVTSFDILSSLIFDPNTSADGVIINNGRENFLIEQAFFLENKVDENPPTEKLKLIKTSFEFKEAAAFPDELLEKLAVAFNDNLQIKAVWAANATKEDKEYFALFIDTFDDDTTNFEQISNICEAYFGDIDKTKILTVTDQVLNRETTPIAPIFIRSE